MKHQIRFILTISLLFYGLSIQAQSAVSSAGGNGGGTDGSFSVSIGQPLYTTVTGNNYCTSQGVQQSYVISVITGEEEENVKLNISAYPNPAAEYLRLKIESPEIKYIIYRMYDIKGNLTNQKRAEGPETEILIQSEPSGTYFLKVTQGNKVLKTFKIIKK